MLEWFGMTETQRRRIKKEERKGEREGEQEHNVRQPGQ